MRSTHVALAIAAVLGLAACSSNPARPLDDALRDKVRHVVVIYGENRSFDNLYGNFPGANGIANATPANTRQVDRDGSPLAMLPPTWSGMNAGVPQSATTNLPNATFRIDDPRGFNQGIAVKTRDLVHRFYHEQMQIDGGR